MVIEKSLTISEEDKNFIDTRENIPKQEFGFGNLGLFLGLFLLIFVSFRDTFKILKKK